MGRLLLVIRLAAKDARRNPAEALLLLVAIVAATTTLTIALALHGVTSAPYQATRAATDGPDVVASVQQSTLPAQLSDLAHAPGVVASSGPYLIAMPNLVVDGHSDPVMAEGRDPPPRRWTNRGSALATGCVTAVWSSSAASPISSVSRSETGSASTNSSAGERVLVEGRVRSGSERRAGLERRATSGGRPVLRGRRNRRHRGAPALAAQQLRPSVGVPRSGPRLGDPRGCRAARRHHRRRLRLHAQPEARRSLRCPRLRRRASARWALTISWQAIAAKEGLIVSIERAILLTGSRLLGLLALASVALLVGGRMEQQTRRVGLLKAVGATPALVGTGSSSLSSSPLPSSRPRWVSSSVGWRRRSSRTPARASSARRRPDARPFDDRDRVGRGGRRGRRRDVAAGGPGFPDEHCQRPCRRGPPPGALGGRLRSRPGSPFRSSSACDSPAVDGAGQCSARQASPSPSGRSSPC